MPPDLTVPSMQIGVRRAEPVDKQRRHTSYIARDWMEEDGERQDLVYRESSVSPRHRSVSPGYRDRSASPGQRDTGQRGDHRERSQSSGSSTMPTPYRSHSPAYRNVTLLGSTISRVKENTEPNTKPKPRPDTEKHNPATYRSIRSMKHKDKAYQEGLRKSSSLTDLTSSSERQSDLEDNLYRSRSRDNITSEYPHRPVSFPSHSTNPLQRPMTLFESLRHSLLNPEPEKPKPKNSRYLRLAGIPQTRPIEEYVGASPAPAPPIRRKSADLGQAGLGGWQSRVGRSRSAGRLPRDKSPEDPASRRQQRSRDTGDLRFNMHATSIGLRNDRNKVAPPTYSATTSTLSPGRPSRSAHLSSAHPPSSNTHMRISANTGSPRQEMKTRVYSSTDSGVYSDTLAAVPSRGASDKPLFDRFLYNGRNKNETDEHKVCILLVILLLFYI